MIPLCHIHRKCTRGYKLHKLQEKIKLLMYIDGIKQYAKNEKELETPIQAVRICREDVRMKFSKSAMLIVKSSK